MPDTSVFNRPGFAGPLAALAFMAAATIPAMAHDGPIPAAFATHADHRTVDISYADWSAILDATVYDAGRSDRTFAMPPRAGIGRRVVMGNTSSLRLEGNRIFLPTFSGRNLKTLESIRAGLEAMPDSVPMAEWTKPQQLAYWLNLYNITMVDTLARHYPQHNIRRLLYGGGGRTGLLDQKLIRVAGMKLSLNDIQYRILMAGWHDPLVMYGLFKGYVGAPSIRKAAFTADTVYDDLRDNAAEFINSNRGARVYKDRLVVSRFYGEIAALFPHFEADLKTHLATYADPAFAARLQSASGIEATTQDYYIADLMQGVTNDGNPNEGNPVSLGNVPLGFVADVKATGALGLPLPSGVFKYVVQIQQKKARKDGHVDVEEVKGDADKKETRP